METKKTLLELRKKNRLTQDEMAEKLMVTRQAVSRWENGETVPSSDTLKIISMIFGISINDLLGQPQNNTCPSCGTPMNSTENSTAGSGRETNAGNVGNINNAGNTTNTGIHYNNNGGNMMKNILITGGAGFIGSNFIQYLLAPEFNYNLINLDVLTYAGNLENLDTVKDSPRYTFIKGNICDGRLLDEIFTKYNIDTVVNFAAETHVDRSIVDPDIFVKTNVTGTHALLECAKKHWKKNPNDKYDREYTPGVKFIQVSTDEVYGTLGDKGLFTETTPLAPNSPYSASKASADMFVRAYNETFGLPMNITRCSNNYGPYQFPEKLIPLMISNCLKNKPLPVYGVGAQVRDWLYVEDHCSAIYAVMAKGSSGEVYNIGGNNEKQNIEVVRLLIKELGKTDELIQYVKDRPGHDMRYAIDNSKITSQLGWVPAYTFESGMKKTIDWYLGNNEWMDRVVSGEYERYYSDMYS